MSPLLKVAVVVVVLLPLRPCVVPAVLRLRQQRAGVAVVVVVVATVVEIVAVVGFHLPCGTLHCVSTSTARTMHTHPSRPVGGLACREVLVASMRMPLEILYRAGMFPSLLNRTNAKRTQNKNRI